MSAGWDAQVRAALEAVPDPCSIAAGAATSLIDMGLVRGWTVSGGGDVEVILDVTSPLCLMAGHFVADARRRLEAIPGVRAVDVRVAPSGEWSPDRISARGRERLAQRRQRVGAPRAVADQTARSAAQRSRAVADQTARSAAQRSRSAANS